MTSPSRLTRPIFQHAYKRLRVSRDQERSIVATCVPCRLSRGSQTAGLLKQQRARFSDVVKGKTSEGMTYKVSLSSRKVVGIYQSRGSREYQEDRTSVHTLHLPPSELLASLSSTSEGATSHHHHNSQNSARHRPTIPLIPSPSREGAPRAPAADAQGKADAGEEVGWDPEKAGGAEFAGQVSYFGIFDGHGGQVVSSHLEANLHPLIETADSSLRNVTDVVEFTRALGGYFKRFRGGALASMVAEVHGRRQDAGEGEENATVTKTARGAEAMGEAPGADGLSEEQRPMTLEERLTLAFLQTDKEILSRDDTSRCGSTASIALLQSLDHPAVPYFYASKLSITVAHCGDTRILLCAKKDGKVEPLTEKHHAESRVEAARLRRLGHNLITDSFGETRWMGAIENTRSLGDKAFKPAGVTAEPEIKRRVIDGDAYCYLVFVTDGISGLMSDQEIVDLAREAHDPYRAAKTIVSFAEDLGAEDNCTCVVVPLAGWGKVGGVDETEERREYRKRKVDQLSTRMARM